MQFALRFSLPKAQKRQNTLPLTAFSTLSSQWLHLLRCGCSCRGEGQESRDCESTTTDAMGCSRL